ncbi:MAG TPA: hypothetical protein VK755_11175 [Candidatus Acidoferrales bacterium]|nr:hypothetical protein [Candidatus Acidoferrales bacterium]
MTFRAAAAVLGLAALLGAGPVHLDSQYVLQRYAVAVGAAPVPKAVVFTYTISQVGPNNIEQRHRIYRSGTDVRDETISVDGIALGRKAVRFSRREDRYTVDRFAPRSDAYELLFLGTARDGRHLDYVYEATPLTKPPGATIDRLTIDGVNFLPRVVHFHGAGLDVTGSGEIEFGPFGKYWMPVMAAAQAHVKGKPARELLTWSEYRFPESLPTSTFQAPEPLPHATPSSM